MRLQRPIYRLPSPARHPTGWKHSEQPVLNAVLSWCIIVLAQSFLACPPAKHLPVDLDVGTSSLFGHSIVEESERFARPYPAMHVTRKLTLIVHLHGLHRSGPLVSEEESVSGSPGTRASYRQSTLFHRRDVSGILSRGMPFARRRAGLWCAALQSLDPDVAAWTSLGMTLASPNRRRRPMAASPYPEAVHPPTTRFEVAGGLLLQSCTNLFLAGGGRAWCCHGRQPAPLLRIFRTGQSTSRDDRSWPADVFRLDIDKPRASN